MYAIPSTALLDKNNRRSTNAEVKAQELVAKLEQTLYDFGIKASVIEVEFSPMGTMLELMPSHGTKVSTITSLEKDLELHLGGKVELDLGTSAGVITVRVAEKKREKINISELIEDRAFEKKRAGLPVAAGIDYSGNNLFMDISEMPHLLIAGTTGSGKSVFMNTIIMSMLFSKKPDELKMILIDPKMVEFNRFNGLPHLLIPVVTETGKAAGAFGWVEHEMKDRYQKLAGVGVRDIKGYNSKIIDGRVKLTDGTEIATEKMPRILIIVDEYGELMYNDKNYMEETICSIARMGRAAGIHLVLATQRPSSDVVTGQIRANISARIAFSVINWRESHTIINQSGAEKLLGNGDMMYLPSDSSNVIHAQAPFVSDGEIDRVVDYIKNNQY